MVAAAHPALRAAGARRAVLAAARSRDPLERASDKIDLALCEVVGEVPRDRAEEFGCRAAELLAALRREDERLAATIGRAGPATDVAKRVQPVDA